MKNKLRILLVDDQHPILLTYTLILRQQGHDVVSASTCESAVHHLHQHSFDMLLCDLGLDDGHNGFEIIDIAQKRNPSLVSVLLTGYGTLEVQQQAEQRGVSVLYKPIAIPELLQTIRTLSITRGAA